MTADPFRVLPSLLADDRSLLRQYAVEVPFRPGELLQKEGSRAESLCVLLSGHAVLAPSWASLTGAAISTASAGLVGTHSIFVGALGPGDLFGERALLFPELSEANIFAQSHGTLLRVPLATLLGLLPKDPGFGARLYKSVATLLLQRTPQPGELRPDQPKGRKPLAGRLRMGHLPASLLSAIQSFKGTLFDLDGRLRVEESAQTPSALRQAEARSEATTEVEKACDQLLRALTFVVQGTADERRADAYGGHTLREIFPIFMQSRLCDRIYSRPRGCSDDHQVMEQIHDNQPAGDGRLGPLLDAWLLRRPTIRGIRTRRTFVRDTLVDCYRSREFPPQATKDPFRILALSGVGKEILDFLAVIPEKSAGSVLGTCVAGDLEALRHGLLQCHGTPMAEEMSFLFAPTLVQKGTAAGSVLHLPPQDVIYCVGVLEGLDDSRASALLNFAAGFLAPSGKLILSNTDPSSPDRALFDHVLDWRLHYRGEAELLQLLSTTPLRGLRMDASLESTKTCVLVTVQQD